MKKVTKKASLNKWLSNRWMLLTLVFTMITSLFLPITVIRASISSVKQLVINSNTRTYTTNADFAGGTLFNLNSVAPNSNQLQLNTQLSTFPVMWVANAGEDTVSKIDTTNNKELARYRTAFGPSGQLGYLNHLGSAYSGAAPSRTAVDSDGNVYVANRHFDAKPPEVIKILAEGGIDRNGNGVIDTSTDTNNNGIIEASEILLIGDTNGNGVIDINEVRDERIAWVSRLPNNLPAAAPFNNRSTLGSLGRSLAIDKNGDIWISSTGNAVYYKMRSSDGQIVVGPINVAGHYPYGALVDSNGILWGATLGGGTLLKLDTNTNAVQTIPIQNGGSYGIALGNGKVYLGGNSPYIEFNPANNIFTPKNGGIGTSGLAVDSQGNIFAGNSTVQKYNSGGTLIWSATPYVGTGYGVGIQVDSNSDVWQIDLSTHRICKFRGGDGFKLGCIPVGNSPYTYTDATGISRFNTTTPSGKWSVVQDGGSAGTKWGTVDWNNEPEGNIPAGTSIIFEARTADTQVSLGSVNFAPISKNVKFNMIGQFIEVRATLTANTAGESPVLSDVTITEGNSAPVANNDDYTTDEDTLFNVAAPGALGNDTDGENDTLNASLVSGPTNAASFSLNGDGSFSYTPNPNFNGSDSFTYKVSDGDLESNTATVSIMIDPVNDNPTANNDTTQVDEDATLNVAAPGVIGNDSDIENSGLTATLVTGPTNAASFTLNSDGSYTYTPNPNFNGSDSFTYKVSDGELESNTVSVSITVDPVNDAPTADNDSYGVNEDTALNVAAPGVVGNDSDIENSSLTAMVVSGPSNAASFTLDADGSFAYTPAANFHGTDSFTYKASDSELESNTATVQITVNPINDAPTMNGATISRQKAVAGTVSTIATVSDVDNTAGSLTVMTTSVPAGITVSGITNNNGTITATVAAGCGAAVGANTVGLKVTDSSGDMGTANLSVNVTAENIPPVINPIANVTATLPPNSNATSMAVNFPLPTASDNCGEPVTVTTNPVSGSTFNIGTTTVNVTATDQSGNQSFATFTVSVQYSFSMFYYSNLLLSQTALNQVTAGSNVPIRFTLSGYKGDPYSSPPTSQQINCSTFAPTGAATVIDRFAPDPSYSSFYDFYQTTWRTQASWKFTCRRLSLHMNDGTTKTLDFYFK